MAQQLPQLWLVRHGETEWSASGRHTGWSDIALTSTGEGQARAAGAALAQHSFATVMSSPLQRALRTCTIAGYGDKAVVDPDLREWNYGDYEGKTAQQIKAGRPGWELFRDGCPGGETLEAVAARADRVISRVRAANTAPGGDTLLFSSGHFLRILAARWIGQPPQLARFLYLDTAALAVLGYHHDLDDVVILRWNQVNRLPGAA